MPALYSAGVSDSPSDDDVDRARRRFLLAGGAYVAPAVLASFFLGKDALAQSGCPPYVNRCSPFRACAPGRCGPLTTPCRPA